MYTTGAPELTWVDRDDDFKRFLIEAQEDWNCLYPSTSTAWVIPTNQNWLWPGDSSNLLDPDPFVPPGTFDGGLAHAPQFITQTVHDCQMLAPGISPRSTESHGDIQVDPSPPLLGVDHPLSHYSWKLPPTPGSETIPPPPAYIWYSNGGHWSGDGGDNSYGDEADDNFSGGGISNHWGWTDTPAQESGTSANLAPAKPEIIENDIQSEQSSRSTPSSSRGKYNRAENEEGKRLRLSHIREALGISSTEDELPTLQKLIEYLGGSVPEHEVSHGWLTKPRRQAKKRAELRECFRELRNIVSPWNARLGDLKVLTLALELVTSQVGGQRGSEGGYQLLYGVFRLR
ncbi:hypothetical protein BJ322DRAFT_528809 [Thelephora terrestris]|uniref:BHLH domain-containing protein n=1 Tax=Thelephora terrestris TaxID=56493 RepID=A0A9P6HM16_9AGAM|nr:hypothetical protein BJ322DRAFT_528809 [Thelephora terrestris]